jgi:hypothetical protein
MNLSATNSDAGAADCGLSATAIAGLMTAVQQGTALVSAWRLSDEGVVQRHEHSDVGCGCGAGPIE